MRIKPIYTVHDLNRNKTNFKCKKVKKMAFFKATLEKKIETSVFSNFKTLLSATFSEFIGNLWLSLVRRREMTALERCLT